MRSHNGSGGRTWNRTVGPVGSPNTATIGRPGRRNRPAGRGNRNGTGLEIVGRNLGNGGSPKAPGPGGAAPRPRRGSPSPSRPPPPPPSPPPSPPPPRRRPPRPAAPTPPARPGRD